MSNANAGYPYFYTDRENDESLTIIIDGTPKTVYGTHGVFPDLFEAVKKKQWAKVREFVDLATTVKVKSDGLFTVVDEVVHIDGNPVVDSLSQKILSFARKGLPYDSLILFWKNLNENPSNRSVTCLYNFLEHNNVPITEDGCFIAYKGVRKDWKDCHSGTVDNSPGTTVKMERNKVNDDPNQTCSHGLHVAGWNYATGTAYGGANRYLQVKVNPRDVVAVPTDYQFQKMRVCEYLVLREVDNPLDKDVDVTRSDGTAASFVREHLNHDWDEDEDEEEDDWEEDEDDDEYDDEDEDEWDDEDEEE